MNYRKRILQIILAVVILALPTYGCAIRSTVNGWVIDAETGKPIEGVVVLISWTRPSIGLPGLSGTTSVETYETTSDAKGYFKIPNYTGFRHKYILTIYKKGYVCWNNSTIFPTHEDRKDFTLESNMVIKMEKFKEGYNKLEHAKFVIALSGATFWLKKPSTFEEAIKEENLLLDEWAKQLRKELEEKKKEK